jgi:coenzyme F420-reducing hydrogenase alpha subunit
MGMLLADQELDHLSECRSGAVTSSFLYHYARLIEILAAIERIQDMIDDAALVSVNLRADAGNNKLEGVGASDGRRGTLFHQSQVDANGLMQVLNMIIACGQNSLAMNGPWQKSRGIILYPGAHEDHPGAATRPGGGRHPGLRPMSELVDPRSGKNSFAGLSRGL